MVILFRLLGFIFRVVASFFFVFFLQIQFNGKTLETYLTDFGKSFIVTKTLKKVSQDGVKFIKQVSDSNKKQKPADHEQKPADLRELASKNSFQQDLKDFSKKITLPFESFNKKAEKTEDLNQEE